ncbi:MAG: ABC transporter ATP-binding protein [Planctomycetes bacterium]|nr:ABC transporter ATP-binding protein [Planctomycetota bacterium]
MAGDGKRGASVRVRGVTKQFQTRRGPLVALEDVSFDCAPGEFVAVVGPSGCGKSTLLSLIAGLEPSSEGSVEIRGQRVTSVRHDVGLMFQKDALLPWKTVADNVALPLHFRGVPRAQARERAAGWLRRVGLSQFMDYYPHQLSGGMRKRGSLATLLSYSPDVLLMDEPFSALDVQTRKLMEDELLELWTEERKTVVFITHDLEEAIALSDRVIVMTASPGRIKNNYQVDLPRPRHVANIRFDPAFVSLYRRMWDDLEQEVAIAYQRQLVAT